ncbi:MAG: thiamine pyrophosphate-binding protein [Chloroflexota bacterium]|nr:thiamine pyrophosphate-binding protein [Chloroflexota bacterium]
MVQTVEKESKGPASLPMNGGRLIARILKEHGVKYVFGVMGGHLYPLEPAFYEQGIRRIHVRHEQSGAYAADAYARCSRSPGICYGTAGPGMTNMVSGLNQAFLARSPVVAIFGSHTPEQDFLGPFQEGYGDQICKSMAKWTVRIHDWRLVSMYMRKALRDCMIYPPGPVMVTADTAALSKWPGQEKELMGEIPSDQKAAPSPCPGDPKAIEQAVAMLLRAERPAMVGGDGVWWADAAAELRELAELLRIPTSTRRLGRGALPEDHPLAVHGGWRSQFWKDADVVLSVGMKLSNLEGFGRQGWPAKAKRILVHESVMDAWAPVPAALEVIGNAKLVLRQIIDCAKAQMKEPPVRTAWMEHLAAVKKTFEDGQRESIEEMRDWKPVHPFVLGKEIVDFLDDDATIIFDSFTGSSHLTDKIKAKYPGLVLDSGEAGGVGHGVGMGIGAQLARPGKQVLVMMGDAGIGIAGFDIETAVRYCLPICYVIYNNSTWMGGCEEKWMVGQVDSWAMLPDIRYDQVFAPLGCHVEHVTEHGQIRPALERAFKSGKTSVLNVIADRRVGNPTQLVKGYRDRMMSVIDPSKLPEDVREFAVKGYTAEVEAELRKKGWPMLKARGKISSRDG